MPRFQTADFGDYISGSENLAAACCFCSLQFMYGILLSFPVLQENSCHARKHSFNQFFQPVSLTLWDVETIMINRLSFLHISKNKQQKHSHCCFPYKSIPSCTENCGKPTTIPRNSLQTFWVFPDRQSASGKATLHILKQTSWSGWVSCMVVHWIICWKIPWRQTTQPRTHPQTIPLSCFERLFMSEKAKRRYVECLYGILERMQRGL